ncbi:hypothetical protein I316_04093 [Kwoniella heveanensis BCC8398]|uniref:Uncharacterized protein n=1 Tax=Kwoniella heveanensis BCC8398 TaxID=1296120 RepID=A0A1B9GT06_9TREE|nr:hypothetical protein I316_04093 [Kwoniella heveanensis BCC8398]
MAPRTNNIVIIGSDLIGTSTAYYLSQSPNLDEDTNVILVEEDEVGGNSQKCGSGLIGGGGGGDVGSVDGTSTSLPDLTEFSLKLHSKLARAYDGILKWGYSPIEVHRAEFDHPASSSSFSSSPQGFATKSSSPSSPISTHFPALRSVHASSSAPSLPSTSTASSAVIDPVLLTRHLCSIFLSHPRCSLLIAEATSLTFAEEPRHGSSSSSPSSGATGEKRRVSGVNVVQKINGVEEIVHVAADSVLISTGSKLLSTSKTLLGGEAVHRLRLDERIAEERRECVVMKPREKIDPLALRVKVGQGERVGGKDSGLQNGSDFGGTLPGNPDVEIVIRDDGRVHICRTVPGTMSSGSSRSPSIRPRVSVNGHNRESDAGTDGKDIDGHTNHQPEPQQDLLTIVESITPHLKLSIGTLLISHTRHQVPFLTINAISSAEPGDPDAQAALAGPVDGFQGVWMGLSHRSDPTLGPGIGSILAEQILGVKSTTDINLDEFRP